MVLGGFGQPQCAWSVTVFTMMHMGRTQVEQISPVSHTVGHSPGPITGSDADAVGAGETSVTSLKTLVR